MIGFLPTLRAELVRTRGSSASVLPLLGIVIAGISAAGVYITPQSEERAVLLWQTLYVTGMAAGILALLAGLTTGRETAAREGGTQWRPMNPRLVTVARFAVLAGLSAEFHLLAFWAVIPPVILAGAPLDVGGVLTAGIACWVATLGLLAVTYVATERWGTVLVFLLAWVWQAIGILAAEWPSWVALPPTWAVRAMLPLLGAHQNGEPLSPNDPLLHESPVLALCLSVGLMLVVLMARLTLKVTPRLESRTNSGPIGYRSARDGALVAINLTMRGRPVIPLCLAAIVASTVVAVVYPPSYLLGFYTYALLPLGACVVAVLLWQTLVPGWRLVVLHGANLPRAVQAWLLGCVTAVTLVVVILTYMNTALHGDSAEITTVVRAGVLWLLLGAAGSLGALWITVRYGMARALGAAAVLVIVGATFGGDVLADTWMWVLGPTAWPLSADSPSRFVLAGSIGIIAILAGWFASARAMRTATAREV